MCHFRRLHLEIHMGFILPAKRPEEFVRLKVSLPSDLADWVREQSKTSGHTEDMVVVEAVRYARGKSKPKSAKKSAPSASPEQ